MEKGRLKWWFALLAGVLAVVVCGACVFVYARPKLVLISALPQLFSQLEERFRDDPIWMAADVFDRDGRYTADVLLRANPVTYDLTVQTDFSNHCFSADGTIRSSEKAVDVRLYLDASIAAVSSKELVKGDYYGIAYDSFASDIRNMPMFSPFVSEDTLVRWTNSVQRLKETMSWEYPQIALPTLSSQEIETLLLGIAALPCAKETVSTPINGEILSCLKLDFFLNGEQLESILGNTAEKRYPNDAAVSASFYLYDGSLVKLRIQDQQGTEAHTYTITFGRDPLHNPLSFEETENLAGKSTSYCVYVETKSQDDGLTQTIRYSSGQPATAVCSYQWVASSGIMYVKTDANSEAAKILLSKGKDGLQIKTDDLGQLVQVLTRSERDVKPLDSVACSMTIQRGAQIQRPSYRNVDSWSFDDLLILVGGIGSVVGWELS